MIHHLNFNYGFSVVIKELFLEIKFFVRRPDWCISLPCIPGRTLVLKKLTNFLLSISRKTLFNSFSAPKKLLPLSDCISITILLPIIFWRAWVNESVSIWWVTSMRTALLARNKNITPYLLSSDLFSLI